MSLPYEFVLAGPAARALLGQSAGVRRRTLDCLESLASDPFRVPDLTETSPSGRSYFIVVERDIIVSYWVDHAVCELRVIELEWV